MTFCTLGFFKPYKKEPAVVRPSSLLSCLPQIISGFQRGSQQGAAEFLQGFWRLLGENADHLQTIGLIPKTCNLEFLRSLYFTVKSDILCTECNNVTTSSVMETVLPLPVTKVQYNNILSTTIIYSSSKLLILTNPF